MRRKLLVKRKNRRRQEALKEARGVFTRLNNRSNNPRHTDFINAGYPHVIYKGAVWKDMHVLCKETFVNEKGQSTYTWFGSAFFFLTDEDAHVFKALTYLV